ncbi:MAG: hypothetical protein QOH70_1961 [Blastocatellia bacterium]|jgi:hypothetical protein|nr:hypothetical protein [Blastocatellia bacterium]
MDPRLDEHYESVHESREILRDASVLCVKKLRVIVSPLTRPMFNADSLDFRDVFRDILEVMGLALFNATEPFLKEQWEQRTLNFYFWPGYDSILHDEPKSKRITLLWEDSPDRTILCGSGHQLTKDPSYKESNTSLWFERALTICEEANGLFVPGGTHAWVGQDNLKILDTEKAAEDWDYLSALRVQIIKDGVNAYSAKRGFALLQFRDQDYSSWGKLGARWLNDRSRIISRETWPTPLESKVDTTKSEREKIQLQIFRQQLYNIWLAATFDIDWRTDWFFTFLKRLRRRGLNALAARLEREPLDQTYLRKPPFRWWYTLQLESSLEKTTGTEALGSAMFLSSAELPAAYIYLATAFVNEMYFQMRDVERTFRIEQVAELAGQDKQASIFAHQTVGLITEPWVDPARRKLKEESQFSLWMAKTLVTEIWGSVDLDSEGSIWEGSGADFPEWEGLNPREMLEKILSPAMFQGLRRAAKAPRLSGDSELDDLNERSKKLATNLLYKRAERGVMLRRRLGLRLPEGLPPDWTTYKGFMLSFYHIVWQATHHALKASLEEGNEPYLWIEWDTKRVTVFNRSPSIALAIAPPKDKRFLDILQSKLRSSFIIEGPEPTNEDQTIWRTAISYRGVTER